MFIELKIRARGRPFHDFNIILLKPHMNQFIVVNRGIVLYKNRMII